MTLFDGFDETNRRPQCRVDGCTEDTEPGSAWCADHKVPYQLHSVTSREAADVVRPDARTLRERVYLWLARHGPATDEQIQDGLGMNPSTERPRRIELVARGRVYDTGMKARTRSGRRAVLWAVRSR